MDSEKKSEVWRYGVREREIRSDEESNGEI
jgi:hypothetical protein